MKFSEIIEPLRNGATARRWQTAGWEGKYIVMQIPQTIQTAVIPKMMSLPPSVKAPLMTVGDCRITYHNQVLIITIIDGQPNMATSYTPTWEDIFADDWVILM